MSHCPVSGCPWDKVYMLLRTDTQRAVRFSFSRNLLEYLGERYLTCPFEVRQVKFKVGRRLQPGERSDNGMYAIVSERNDKVLRICLFHELSEFLTDESRYRAECYINGPLA